MDRRSRLALIDEILVKIREKGVAYLRELQVLLENPPKVEHWDVTNTLRKYIGSRVGARSYRNYRWFYDLRATQWADVQGIADEKAELIDYYSKYARENEFVSQPQGIRYDDYSEYLVEDALRQAGFIVTGKNSTYFDGRQYVPTAVQPGRPADLDFTAVSRSKQVFVGVSVKNRLDYPTSGDIDQVLVICDVLKLKPLLVARMASAEAFGRVPAAGGRVVPFKRWLLKPGMPRNMFDQISDAGRGKSVLALPVSIYRYAPSMLVELLKEAHRVLG